MHGWLTGGQFSLRKNTKNGNNRIITEVIQGGEILMRLYETNRLIFRELDETFALTVLNYYQRNK